ncbi:MAG: FtsW/RodA/SpoVE family cell cycle protein [Bacteroidetes bacterium]|nr:FtsW/RodA/SpoVE family cell cycle protein [Bacteroidota bacterium]
MKNIYSFIHGDKIIWWVVFLLSLMSIAMVYKSTGSLAYRFQGGNTEFYLMKHLLMLFLGLGIIYFTHLVKYKYFSRLSQILLIISIPLLLLTMLAGQSEHSADRWLVIPGIGVSFQTSDLAKLALITYLARVLHKRQEGQKFKEIFFPIIAPVFLVCGLIVKVNFSTAALIFGTSMVLLFIGRIPFKYILYTVGMAIGAFALFIMLVITFAPDNNRVQTWINRVDAWGGSEDANGKASDEDAEANYQSNLAKATIVSGGVFGNWFGGKADAPTPPQAFSDFMYASLIKETGFIGGIFCIFLYLLLFYRSIRIAVKSESTFAMLLVVGCSISLIFQAFSNMGVAVGLFPVTGQPLPYLSMGGTSLWFTSISLGIILSVSKDVYDKQADKQQAVATGNN